MTPEILAQLAPTGVLRAGINLSNFLLVTGRSPEGEPEGVSPGMARAIADGCAVAKAETLANADDVVAAGYTLSLQTAALADAAKSKLTQLREQVATGRSVMVGEREADRQHAAGLSGAA